MIPKLAWIADDKVMSAEDHRHSIQQSACWVAELDGQLVGFLSAEPQGDELHIWQVAVARPFQGKGVGRCVVQSVITEARRKRFKALTLTTFRGVPWNEPFYQSLGFETLTSNEVDRRLGAILNRELQQGLPADWRCAMRLRLVDSG